MQIEQRVAGRDVGIGSMVVGVVPERVVSATSGDREVEMRQYQPGGRTDLEETEIVIHDLWDGEVVDLVLEVTD